MSDSTIPVALGAPTQLKRAEHDVSSYIVRPAINIPLEVVMSEPFWVHVHRTLRINDIVEVFAQDTSYYAKLWLTRKETGPNDSLRSIRWRVLVHQEFGEGAPAKHVDLSALEVKYLGPAVRFCVIDAKSRERIAEGLEDKAAAEAALERILRERAA